MNQSRSNNTKMHAIDMEEQTKIHMSSDSMKSFFQQLARENCVIGFSLVSDNALPPRYTSKRSSAPAVINGSTRKMLSESYDEAPSCPARRSSSRDFGDHSPALFLETIFDEVIDTVLDEGNGALYDVDQEGEKDEDQSIDSCSHHHPSPSATPLQEEDPNFDSSFQRFSVDPSGICESPESSTRSSASQREQMVAPKLPVRRESLEHISSIGSYNSRLSSGSIEAVSLEQAALVPPESPCPQEKMGECLVSSPTRQCVLDMNDVDAIFVSPLGRRRRQKRRSSLDSGATFRSSFNSQSSQN